MDDHLNFETFLSLSPKKFVISSHSILNKNLYEKELNFENKSKKLDLKTLDHFLNENVFKIEKDLNNFIKNIFLIIDCYEFFTLNLSIKKNNYGDFITNDNLSYILNEARDQCSDTLNDKRIIHILIDSYLVDDIKYSNLPQNLKCKYFSLDIRFLCLPENYLKDLEKIVNKYQISIKKLISMKYLKGLFPNEDIKLPDMVRKVNEGYNLNEVVLTPKKTKNMSFFERFFHFFS